MNKKNQTHKELILYGLSVRLNGLVRRKEKQEKIDSVKQMIDRAKKELGAV